MSKQTHSDIHGGMPEDAAEGLRVRLEWRDRKIPYPHLGVEWRWALYGNSGAMLCASAWSLNVAYVRRSWKHFARLSGFRPANI